ncbi:MAG: DUF3526 domain-containing protein [Pseudomonadota bacterium]
MSGVLMAKDAALMQREPLLRALLIAVLVLLLVALFSGAQRGAQFAQERTAAQAADHEVWLEQGERNPHSAAHFSRYAFRPVAPLALLDPGVSDFAGLAVWMEAHFQDPADFRRAEDASQLSRFAQLSPAFLLLTAAPLLIFVMLYASIAGEREDGTMRQLLASGVGADEIYLGKLQAGLWIVLRVYTLVFLPISIVAVGGASSGQAGDVLLRLALLYVTYAVYLSIFVAMAIGVSALCRGRLTALSTLAGLWVLMAVLVPRLGAGVATTLHPQPDARATETRLGEASYLWWGDEQMQARTREDALAQHGVDDVAKLPFNYEAYTLQASEEVSNPVFDRIYADLVARYRAQESVVRSFSLLSPSLPTTSLSRALAGTDRAHHEAFTEAAETRRRQMIKMLNEDFMVHAGEAGYGYTAGRDLWERFGDFAYRAPSFPSMLGRYAFDVLLLLGWLAAAVTTSRAFVRRAASGEAVAP